MNLPDLRDFTPARVALSRTGHSLRTTDLLALQLAHAKARDAVHAKLDSQRIGRELSSKVLECLIVHSAAGDRIVYLQRPDLGRQLTPESRELLTEHRGSFDVVFLLIDGLSALAVERHAPPLMDSILDRLPLADWSVAPLVIVEQGRVAIGDEAGQILGAALSVVLIGERPGLSSPDSLSVYLTWHPRAGLTNADRNCISNIRSDGLTYEEAAYKLLFLMAAARQGKLSGVELKEGSKGLQS